MKVNKICYFFMQDQFSTQPQYNKKNSKVYTWRNKCKAQDRKTNFSFDLFQIITLVWKFIKKKKISHKNCKNFKHMYIIR